MWLCCMKIDTSEKVSCVHGLMSYAYRHLQNWNDTGFSFSVVYNINLVINIKQSEKHFVHKLRTDPPLVQTIMKVLLLHKTIIICKNILQYFVWVCVEELAGLQLII